MFLQSLQTVAESKRIAKHSLGTLDQRAAAASEMTVGPITEFQDDSCFTAVQIGESHTRTSAEKPKPLHATEQWGYDYTRFCAADFSGEVGRKVNCHVI